VKDTILQVRAATFPTWNIGTLELPRIETPKECNWATSKKSADRVA